MLSNTNTHTVDRRQNSNPDIRQFADTVIQLPAQPRQLRNIASKGHRRGLSLDPRLFSQSPRPQPYQEAPSSASMTNQGQHPSQQTMQETQTLGLDRPGRDIQRQIFDNFGHSEFPQQDYQLYHPQPQQPLRPMYNVKHPETVDTSRFAPFPDPFGNPFNLTTSKADTISNGQEAHIDIFDQTAHAPSPKEVSSQLTDFNMSEDKSRRGSVQSFHSMPNTCPSTPKRHSTTSHLMTPAATPHHRQTGSTSTIKRHSIDLFEASSDPFATIRASQSTPMKRELSYQDNFTAMRRSSAVKTLDASEASWPTPPNTAPMPSRYFHPPRVGNSLGLIDFTQAMHHYSSSNSSFQSSPDMKYETSPEITAIDFFEDFPNINVQSGDIDAPTPQEHCLNHDTNLDTLPLQPKQEINPLAVTLNEAVIGHQIPTILEPEDIGAFIGGPDNNGEWVCLYTDCNRPFKRKENIKSHIQTHLNDRQYVCLQCPAKFVRPHDLKRHENIHSESKPFPCPCGKRFNRHDALTRHRQRDTCAGGVGGATKPRTKRGRPKKASRPDSEERREKAARTRQRAMEKAAARASGTSSSASSPPATFENLSIKGSTPDPFEIAPVLQSSEFFNMSFTPPTSPSHYSTGDRFDTSPAHTYDSFAASPMSSIPELELGELGSSPSATQSFDEFFAEENFASVAKGEFGDDEDLFALAEGWGAGGTL